MNTIILTMISLLLPIIIFCLFIQVMKYFADKHLKNNFDDTVDHMYPNNILKLVKGTKVLLIVCSFGVILLGLLNLFYN